MYTCTATVQTVLVRAHYNTVLSGTWLQSNGMHPWTKLSLINKEWTLSWDAGCHGYEKCQHGCCVPPHRCYRTAAASTFSQTHNHTQLSTMGTDMRTTSLSVLTRTTRCCLQSRLFLQISIVWNKEIASCQADAHTTLPSHGTTALLMHLCTTTQLPTCLDQCPSQCLHTTPMAHKVPSPNIIALLTPFTQNNYLPQSLHTTSLSI